MKNEAFSFWEKRSFFGNVDTVVIGAGIVGLCAAQRRMEMHPHERILVLDRAPLGGGGSTKNAGFACFGSVTELLSDLNSMKESQVFQLVQKRYEGLKYLRQLLGDEQISYTPCGSYELFTERESDLASDAAAAIPRLNQMLRAITGGETYLSKPIDEVQQRHHFAGFEQAIFNPFEGSIDTGKMMYSLRKKILNQGIEIYNGVDVSEITPDSAGVNIAINDHLIRAKKVMVCNNAFAAELIPNADVKPARNLVMVTTPIEGLNWQGTFHMNEGFVYFRNIENHILIGGARHLDPDYNDCDSDIPDKIKTHLERLLKEHILPDQKFEIEAQWTGYLGIGSTREVIVDRIHEHVVCAVRMGGMGVAIGALIGREAADLLES